MEKIGGRKIWALFDEDSAARPATNQQVRAGAGHFVQTYFQLTQKVAELSFRNRDLFLLFRGQGNEYRTTKGNASLKPSLFRPGSNGKLPKKLLAGRFARLLKAEEELTERYTAAKLLGFEQLARQRLMRWVILQHYGVCATPLLDVTQSLRVACSFASLGRDTSDRYLYVLGVPNLSGAVTASVESGMQIVRLSSACPPAATRPHVQEGYLLGEYPEMDSFDQHTKYRPYETDFAQRLIAKFRFRPDELWHSPNFQGISEDGLLPHEGRDVLLPVVDEIKQALGPEVA